MRFINTFGGAVTHLSDKFETFELSKKQAEIKKYIDDNPADLATKIAWEAFLEGTQNKYKKTEQIYYLWHATDLATGKEYHATSSGDLGKQIGASKTTVGFACRNRKLVKGHYQITREASGKSKNIWIAKNRITQVVIIADTAEQLAKRIGAHPTTIVNYRRDHRLVHGRYSITREKRKKAQ
ncbi:MAG: hypothetical protein MRZ40_10200 [Ligilactobacillus animalis]|uniref:hypothetical protein n=1 Tax=Ligilactobacillus animalis TaxID=1605 RepID=UPI00242F2F91|nr:hypothetical protein [Ligilactobacillus animalis]MCI5942924.1 hypothetical protein [Ligilactobacillus animalis]MDY2993758.1 hypothetical protein [Ligilactobacillus animalis]